jgi:hypothetical protein
MVKIMPMRSVPERHLFSELFDGDPQKLVNFIASASHWK